MALLELLNRGDFQADDGQDTKVPSNPSNAEKNRLPGHLDRAGVDLDLLIIIILAGTGTVTDRVTF